MQLPFFLVSVGLFLVAECSLHESLSAMHIAILSGR